MAYCMKCGAQLGETDRFCQRCGTPAGTIQTPAAVPMPVQPQTLLPLHTVPELMMAASKYQPIGLVQVHELAFAEVVKLLRPDEEVLCAFTGSSAMRGNNSMFGFVSVALTKDRLLIGGQIKGWVQVSYAAQSFSLEHVNAVSETYSMFGGDLIIDTLGDDIRIGETSREIVGRIIVDLEAALHVIRQERKASMGVVQQVSGADELKKFKELLDMGVITQEEFDAKKKQILGL